MKTSYPSGISWALFVPLILLLFAVGLIVAFENIWLALLLIAPVIAFIMSVLTQTLYVIEQHSLNIKASVFYHKKIDITQIKSIKSTTSILSSPANSFKNRIEIKFNKWDTIIVSPKDKDAFINHLLTINPNIELRLK